MSNFSISHSVFYSFRELSAIFIKYIIVFCKPFQFGSLKLVVWERVKYLLLHLKHSKFRGTFIIIVTVNPLPDEKNLDWSKLKEIADNILKCIESEK